MNAFDITVKMPLVFMQYQVHNMRAVDMASDMATVRGP